MRLPGDGLYFTAPLVLIMAALFFACSNGGGEPRSWTVMFYANGDNNLEHYIASDLKEMESAAAAGARLDIVALLDRTPGYSTAFGDWSDTRMFEIRFGGATAAAKELSCPALGLTAGDTRDELDMGDWKTLASFVGFCVDNYSSDHYALVIGDHGSGWLPSVAGPSRSISWDGSSFGSRISVPQLRQALSGKGIDVVVLDACLMGGVEVAYELRNCARYLVASPGPEPVAGYDFSITVGELASRTFSPGEFSMGFLDGYRLTNGDASDPVMRFDLDGIAGIVESGSIDGLAAMAKIRGSSDLANARGRSDSYRYEGTDIYIDLVDLADSLGRDDLAFSLRESVRGPEPGQCAVSVYFPPGPGEYDASYPSALDFTAATSWDELLEWYYSAP